MQNFEEFKAAWDELVAEHGTGDELALAIWNAMQENEQDDDQSHNHMTDEELEGYDGSGASF